MILEKFTCLTLVFPLYFADISSSKYTGTDSLYLSSVFHASVSWCEGDGVWGVWFLRQAVMKFDI